MIYIFMYTCIPLTSDSNVQNVADDMVVMEDKRTPPSPPPTTRCLGWARLGASRAFRFQNHSRLITFQNHSGLMTFQNHSGLMARPRKGKLRTTVGIAVGSGFGV